MAATAIKGEAKPNGAGRFSHIHHVVDSVFLWNSATLTVDRMVSIESGRKNLFFRWLGEQIAGDLPFRKLIEREIVIKGSDHPISPRPHRPFVVALVAIGIGVPCRIEPVPGHSLAIGR